MIDRGGAWRQDIQGLRGIAVLLVVLFHVGVLLPGGFIGVDMFFVVSGFVIAAMLQREVTRTGGVSVGRFFTRRIRRLMPAHALMVATVLVASILILSPDGEQQAAAVTALAATLLAANVALGLRGDDYFGPVAEENPFLHLWSLSVEEQFYLALPLVVIGALALARRGGLRRPNPDGGGAGNGGADEEPGHEHTARRARRVLLWALASVGLASLGLSVATAVVPEVFPVNAERFGFYSPFTRAWQFVAGALLALALHPAGDLREGHGGGTSALAALGAFAGVLCLVAGGRWLHAGVPWPGVMGVVPVLGTALLLAVAPRVALLRRGLSWAPLVRLGDVSYGWYLWHWPAIVVVRRLVPGAGEGLLLLAAVVSLVPTVISYRWLEQPVRMARGASARQTARLAGVCVLLPLALSVVMLKGADRGWGLEALPGVGERVVARDFPCGDGRWGPPGQRCEFAVAGSRGVVLVLGDSHAASLGEAVIAAADGLRLDTAIHWRSFCPFLLNVAPAGSADCAGVQARAWEVVDELAPVAVVIANHGAAYTAFAPHPLPAPRVLALADGGAAEDAASAMARYAAGLEGAVAELGRRDIPVLLVDPAPVFEGFVDLRRSLWRPEPVGRTLTPADLEEQRGAVVAVHRDIAARHSHVQLADPAELLCTAEACALREDEVYLYYDAHHLNAHGNRRLVPLLERALGRVAGEGR